jgi:hypothetical protein
MDLPPSWVRLSPRAQSLRLLPQYHSIEMQIDQFIKHKELYIRRDEKLKLKEQSRNTGKQTGDGES